MKRSLWLALLSTACTGGLHVTVKDPPQKLEIVGAFVYPVAFRWEEPAWRSFELSQRLIDVGIAQAGDRLAFFGPTEFKVMRADDDAAWVATTALPVLTGTGARPDQGLVFRPWAERRISSSTQERQDAKGRAAGGVADEETLYLGHLEVVHPSTHEVLMELTGEVKVDPFAAPGPEADYDVAPQLTALMEKLMRTASRRAADWAVARPSVTLPEARLAMTPQAALRWQDATRPPAELEMAKMDAASLELFVIARARFLNPTLTDAQASKLKGLLPGLVVLAPGFGTLSEGDLITTLDDAPAQPQVWARLRFSHQVLAKVRKPSGEIQEVLLP